MLDSVSKCWGSIYNSTTMLDEQHFRHRFRNAFRHLTRKQCPLQEKGGLDFMEHVEKAKANAPGLDGRTMVELKALPLEMLQNVAELFDLLVQNLR